MSETPSPGPMIQVPGSLRSALEMAYFIEAAPCPRCGAHNAVDDYDLKSGISERGGDEIFMFGECPACGAARAFHFHAPDGAFSADVDVFELGGPQPSTVLDPHQLMAELDRQESLMPEDPPAGDPGPVRDAIARALTTIVELDKFIPPGADEVPPAAFRTQAGRDDLRQRPSRYGRSWLEVCKQRLAQRHQRYNAEAAAAAAAAPGEPTAPTLGTLDAASLEAHLQWVRRRGTGAGRLSLHGVRAAGAKIGAKELSGAIFADCLFDGADICHATIASAQLHRVSLRGAGLASTSFAGSLIRDSVFDGAGMVHARMGDAAIERCSFADAELDLSTWYRTKAAGCSFARVRFGNAALDQASFTDCDFRGADLALRSPQPLGTTWRTRFERCDLREVTWTGRSLGGALFVDCKLGGDGKPSIDGAVTIERAEVRGELLDGDAALAALVWK
jgi:uncharacterized protein YjbI with pentapeptide repeats